MLSIKENTKFCWICGRDVALEVCITDEHGLSVHHSCYEKRMLLNAATRATDLWRKLRVKRDAA